jgi:hypothetical protein
MICSLKSHSGLNDKVDQNNHSGKALADVNKQSFLNFRRGFSIGISNLKDLQN